jgi:hypothetical protein
MHILNVNTLSEDDIYGYHNDGKWENGALYTLLSNCMKSNQHIQHTSRKANVLSRSYSKIGSLANPVPFTSHDFIVFDGGVSLNYYQHNNWIQKCLGCMRGSDRDIYLKNGDYIRLSTEMVFILETDTIKEIDPSYLSRFNIFNVEESINPNCIISSFFYQSTEPICKEFKDKGIEFLSKMFECFKQLQTYMIFPIQENMICCQLIDLLQIYIHELQKSFYINMIDYTPSSTSKVKQGASVFTNFKLKDIIRKYKKRTSSASSSKFINFK